MMLNIVSVVAVVALLCGVVSAQEKVIAEGGEGWRKPFGPKEVIQRVRPTQSDEYLYNPHKGTTTFQRFNGDPLYPGNRWNDARGPEEFQPFKGDPKTLENQRYLPTTMAYCRWVWKVIEPEKGKYRWDIIDGALKAAQERGQTLQLRLQPCAGRSGFPDWFWNTGAPPQSTGRRRRGMPDFNSPQYIEHWSDLIRAFGKRYDGHPSLESFDVAYAGSCGETGGNATPETAEKLVDAYLESFRKTQLVGMLGTHGCKYAKTKGHNLGWRVDCFGDIHMGKFPGEVPENMNWNHMFETYPRSLVRCGMEEAWKTAPVTLETCGTVGRWYDRKYDIDYILEWGLRNHCSVFMPKSCYIPRAWQEKIEAFNKKLGYRFVLRQVTFPLEARPGEQAQFDVYLDNVGVAPIYRDYRLAVRFKQKDVVEVVPFQNDIRKWLPGQVWLSEKLPFPKTLRPGVVRLDLVIVHPKTTKPVVRFAIKEILPDGWHPLRYMDVLE
ncbi:MAG: hypothetical protein AMK75_06365 [Planctomycetes bacterium SM23_65]|nr:MAG: hypothetical protein AMK75_06365 [Planctomycetes bacterium SM23_65]